MAVLKTSYRFPEINLGFVTSARGAGNLTPDKSLGRGAFDQRKGPHGGEIDQKKCQMPCGQPGGGGAWASSDLTHTLLENKIMEIFCINVREPINRSLYLH